MAGVRLEQVSKIYDNGFEAVKAADVQVEDQEFMVLVGPSGCGKSTTLRMVAGLEDVSSGSIHIGERDVTHVAPKDRDIAMVFQNYALYPHMSCFENMAFSLRIRKLPRPEIEERVLDAARILGIEDLLERKPRQLSGGQRQRVAVGRAIVRDPKVFLFDEPLSNLDAKLRVQMRAEISRIHSRLESTMIYVTHDQVEAMTMGDRIVVMKDGEIQQIDTPLKLYHEPVNRFVAGFIGSPPMNFLTGEITQEEGLSWVATGARIPVGEHVEKLGHRVGHKVDLGVRPEILLPVSSGGHFAATVEVVEPMGAETFLHLKVGDVPVSARVSAETQLRYGDAASLTTDVSKLQFFDVDTGLAIV